ncbi:MAG: 30S ribosomal protein S4 [Patescibacteria group bacterium]
MANKYTENSQCKKCRRAGEKLFLKGERCNSAKCAIVKRNFVPGMHGPTQRVGKITNYGKQLKEKQKAKRIYGVLELQFFNYFEKAKAKVGNTGELLFRFLESRLDNTVYRLGLAASRRAARQMVSHGHIQVNGKKVNIPSYQLKAGDVVALSPKAGQKVGYAEALKRIKKAENIPAWLSVSLDKAEGKFTSQPKLGDIAVNIDWRTIVEFYSK